MVDRGAASVGEELDGPRGRCSWTVACAATQRPLDRDPCRVRGRRRVGGELVVVARAPPPSSARSGGRPASATTSTRTTTPVEADLGVTSDESPAQRPQRRGSRPGLDAMGLPWRVIPRNVRGCGDCGPCALGLPAGREAVGAPQRRSPRPRPTARRSWTARRPCGSTVERGRATGVVARVPGGEITIHARQVALAGGSILTPAVLQRSRIAERTAGRSLLLHPVAVMAGFYAARQDPVERRPPERDVRRVREGRRDPRLRGSRPRPPTRACSRAACRGGTRRTIARR